MENHQNINFSNNAFMQDKVFLEDYVNMVEVCTPKCISGYKESGVTVNERQCLEKCYMKTLKMQSHLSSQFGNLMNEI